MAKIGFFFVAGAAGEAPAGALPAAPAAAGGVTVIGFRGVVGVIHYFLYHPLSYPEMTNSAWGIYR
jgi:hypothetical protein